MLVDILPQNTEKILVPIKIGFFVSSFYVFNYYFCIKMRHKYSEKSIKLAKLTKVNKFKKRIFKYPAFRASIINGHYLTTKIY